MNQRQARSHSLWESQASEGYRVRQYIKNNQPPKHKINPKLQKLFLTRKRGKERQRGGGRRDGEIGKGRRKGQEKQSIHRLVTCECLWIYARLSTCIIKQKHYNIPSHVFNHHKYFYGTKDKKKTLLGMAESYFSIEKKIYGELK